MFPIFLLSLSITIPAIFLPKKLRWKFLLKFWPAYGHYINKVVLMMNVKHDDRRDLNDLPQTSLFIANHQSVSDITILAALHPVPTLMKHEVLYVPMFGIVAYLGGCVTVKRKNRNSRRLALLKCQQNLKQGHSLLYYPEGTRSKTNEPKQLKEIHTSLLNFAFKENIAITPVSLYGTKNVVDKDIVKLNQTSWVLTHRIIHPGSFENVDEFINQVWSIIKQGHKELETKVNEP
jgi:1-acyl-sn-glycerol-3-phosphate acyltransferase